MPTESLIGKIIAVARTQGVTQKALAQRAGVPEETLSRAKKRGSARLDFVEALARAAGFDLGVIPRSGHHVLPRPTPTVSFQEKHRVLAWSNPTATPVMLLRRALVAPEFQTLLDAALEFGVDAVTSEWAALKTSGDPEVTRAQPITDRLLRNITHGYHQATS